MDFPWKKWWFLYKWLASDMERCQSGRSCTLGKGVYPLKGTGGSNPPLSARIYRTSILGMRTCASICDASHTFFSARKYSLTIFWIQKFFLYNTPHESIYTIILWMTLNQDWFTLCHWRWRWSFYQYWNSWFCPSYLTTWEEYGSI